MSYNNKNVDPNKIYSLLDRPPVKECGGKLDKEGNDTFWGKSLAIQADEQNGNIHSILSKYEKTGGILPQLIKQNPQYGDYSDVPTYQESLNIVLKAADQFNSLDAKLRHQFQNDPSEFLNFVNNPENGKKLVEMGLAIAKPSQTPVNNPPAAPQAPAPTTATPNA